MLAKKEEDRREGMKGTERPFSKADDYLKILYTKKKYKHIKEIKN